MKTRYCKFFCFTTAMALIFLPCVASSQSLLGNGLAQYDLFGASVSGFANFAIVGASGADANGSDAGAAYVYQYSATGWAKTATLPNDAAGYVDVESYFSRDDRFGRAVAMYGDIAVVGAPYDDPGGVDNAGAAYVFQRAEGSWVLVARLTAGDKQINSEFGASVAIDGVYILIGAPKNDPASVTNAGAVYVYKRPDTGWADMVETSKWSGVNEYATFGASLSISDGWAVVGAPEMNTLTGAAFIYKWDAAGNWFRNTELYGKNVNDRFGTSVAVSGSWVAVGARLYDSAKGDNTGAVYIYDGSSGSWTEPTVLESPGVTLSDADGIDYEYYEKGFGFSVSLRNDVAVFGAYDPYNNSDSDLGHFGNAHVYSVGDWTPEETMIGEGYGYAVHVSDYFIVAGDQESNLRQGAAFVQPTSDVENQPPIIYGLETYSIGLSHGSVKQDTFNIYDIESAADDLSLELICPPFAEACGAAPGVDPLVCEIDLDGSCSANITVAVSGTGETRTIALTTIGDNTANATATETVSIRVTDDVSGATDEAAFEINFDGLPTVDFVGVDSPTIIAERTADNSSSFIAQFNASDRETDYDALTLDAFSTNTTLVPDSGSNLVVDKENKTLTIIPKLDQYGTAKIRLSATDSVGNVSQDEFDLIVNSLPTIGDLDPSGPVPVNNEANQETRTFMISDGEATDVEPLTLNYVGPASSANANLFSNFDYSQSGELITLDITIAPGESGTISIPVKVTDKDGGVATRTFQLPVEGTSPQILTNVTSVSMNEGEFSKPVPFEILDTDTPIGNITKTAISDATWLPKTKLSVSCPSSCTLTIYPPDSANYDPITGPATAKITLTVDDGDPATANGTHDITFTFNRKPSVSALSDIEKDEGDTLAFSFSASDPDPAPNGLSDVAVNAVNVSNPDLFTNLPNPCQINSATGKYKCDLTSFNDCSNGECNFSNQLNDNEWGSASIIVTATDGQGLTKSESFALTVNDVNQPPTMTPSPSSLSISEGGSGFITIDFTDDDGDQLALTVNSLNEDLIPNAFQNLKICEVTTTTPCASISESGWYSVDSYSLTPNETGVYNKVKLFIQPAEYANGTGSVNVTATDGENASPTEQRIDVTVAAVDNQPILEISKTSVSMDDDLDKETAEAYPLGIEVSHPDGVKTLYFNAVLPAGGNFKEAYFIDSAGDPTSSKDIQSGETLSLGLVVIPEPNVITETTSKDIKIIVGDEPLDSDPDPVFKTIAATVTPINDPPSITGLQPQYPCTGCLLDVDPPWLQDERKTIRFQVDDPDPNDKPVSGSLSVEAEWGLGVDTTTTGEYKPEVIGGISSDGQVDLLVQPPDMMSGWLNLTVTVADDENLTYSQDTVINVQGVNYPPEFVEPPETPLETDEDQAARLELTITDAETVRLSKLTLLREWTSVDPIDMPKGTFSGGEISDQGRATLDINPPAGWPKRLDPPAHARVRLAIQEEDGTISEPVLVDVYIQGVPNEPKITSITSLDPAPTIKEGKAFTLDFQVEDGDTPVGNIVVGQPTYDPGITDLTLSLSTPVCTTETNYKQRCKITAQAADQSFGEATISIQVTDDTPADFQGPLTASLEAPLTVTEVEDSPVFKIIDPATPPVITEEDTETSAIYEITDPDVNTVQDDLQVLASSLSWTWTNTTTPDAPVNLASSPGNAIVITPTQNGFGSGVVSIDVTDGTNTVSTSFDVVITPVNDPPTLEFTSSPGDPVDEDTAADLAFTVSDVETPASNLNLSYAITWTEGGKTETLSPYTDYLLVTGTGADKKMTFTPPEGRPISGKGVAIITATVTDRDNNNPLQDVQQAVVEYLAVDDKPVILKRNGVSVETIEEDSGAFYVEFTVSDQETPAGSLITTTPVISGDNPAILPEGSYLFESGGDATRRLKLTPAADENGQVDITVSVLDAPAPDGLESDPLTFTLDVTPVPDPPTISFLKKEGSVAQETQIILDEGQTTADLADTYVVEVSDPDTELNNLIVGAVWDAVPGREADFIDGEIRLEGTAETRTVVITPAEYQSGYARITPWVKDSAGAAPVKAQSFELRVDPVNNPPTLNVPIANPDNIVFVQGNTEYLLRFEVRDVDSAIRNLIVSAESGNTDLLPQTDETRFDWGLIGEFDSTPNLDNMTHGLLMKPLPLGGADSVDVPVKILASDQTDITEFDFTLRIFPDVTPPRIRIADSVNVSEDPATPKVVNFWVWDEKKDPWEMEIFVSSGQTDYIPNSNITVEPIFQSASDPGYSENADNWRLTFKPALNAPFQEAEFTTQLNVSVNNGLFETVADPPLGVTIVNKNDAPVISDIPNQDVHLNETVTVNFTVDDVDEGPADVDVSATADPAIAQFEFTNGASTGEPTKPYVKDWTMKVIPTATSEADTSFRVTVTATDTSGVVSPAAGEEGNTGSVTFMINMGGVAPGDVDGSGTVDLADAIMAIQILAGIQPTSVFVGADINNDGQIGFAEALNALREAAAN